MPFVSRAQARAMHAKAERGEIKKSVVKEFDQDTDFKQLPERVRDHLQSRKGAGRVQRLER